MGFDANVEFLRMAFWQILIISGPLLAVALAIGLTIGILQAATSIQEMTLTQRIFLLIASIRLDYLNLRLYSSLFFST